MWPVYTYLVIILIGLGITLAKHGDYIKINFWTTLISTSITIYLLYKGGFFNVLIR
jgi:multisubunit Na+/H+ antiporter MnhC subunit